MLSVHSGSPPAAWQHKPGKITDLEAVLLVSSFRGNSGDNERHIAWIKPGHAPELSQYEVSFRLTQSNGSSNKSF